MRLDILLYEIQLICRISSPGMGFFRFVIIARLKSPDVIGDTGS